MKKEIEELKEKVKARNYGISYLIDMFCNKCKINNEVMDCSGCKANTFNSAIKYGEKKVEEEKEFIKEIEKGNEKFKKEKDGLNCQEED